MSRVREQNQEDYRLSLFLLHYVISILFKILIQLQLGDFWVIPF